MPKFRLRKQLTKLACVLFGYGFGKWYNRDHVVKPLYCTIVCGIATAFGCKMTYESACLTYDKYVKPVLKAASERK